VHDAIIGLMELLSRLQSCRRVINAAPSRVRVSVGGSERESALAADSTTRVVSDAIEQGCAVFGIRPVEPVGGELSLPSAVERVVSHRLSLATCFADGMPAGVLPLDVPRAVALVSERDPLRQFTFHSVQSPRGLSLHVYECGRRDRPPWVLVLPYGVPVDLCFELARALSPQYRFIAIEGPELSSNPDDFERLQVGLHDSVTDILAVLDHFNLARVHLAGVCASATPTLCFASEHNDRVASIILGNGVFATKFTPNTRFERDFMTLVRHIDGRRDKARVLFRFVSAQDLTQVDPECSHITMVPYASPELLYMFMRCCHGLYATELEETQLDSWLGAIRQPALLLVSDSDAVSSPLASHVVSSKLARSRILVEKNGTHLSPLRAPSPTMIASVLGFCSDVDAELRIHA
jgi:3-oxoadipate enol-lactonase